jgi:hypothetical protein
MATIVIPQTVNPPQPASETAPPLDFSKLFSDYTQGVQFGQQQQVRNAFANGLPTTDGTPNGPIDYQSAMRKLMQFGDYGDASSMMQTGIKANAAATLGQPLLPPGYQSQSAPSATGGTAAAPIANNAPGPQASFYPNLFSHESGFNPNAGDPKHAYGIAQFTPDTWSGVVAAHPELGLPADITKATTDQQIQATQALTGQNVGMLTDAGIPVNDKTAFMAHFLGGQGAVHFFKDMGKNAGALAAPLFPDEAAANPTIFYNPDGSSKNLAQVYQLQTKNFGYGNTTGFNIPPMPQNQVAGPGAPSAAGPLARAADGTPVQTNAQGQAVDPVTGQPVAGSGGTVSPRANVRITNQPTGSAVLTSADGQSMAVPANKFAPVGALSTALGIRAAQDGGTVPGGAASPTGGAAAANAATNAARVAAAPAPAGGGFGTVGPIGPAGSGTPAPPDLAQGDSSAPTVGSSYAQNLKSPPPSNTSARGPGGANPAPAPPPPPPQTSATGDASQFQGAPPQGTLLDPSMGGLVPKPWVDAYGPRASGAYANALYMRGRAAATAGLDDAAKADFTQAQGIEQALRMANTPNPAMKPYEIGHLPGESIVDFNARQAATTAAAEQQAKNANTLVETQPVPGGPKQFDTAAHLLNAINAGKAGPNASVGPGAGSPPGGGGVPSDLPVASQPAFIAKRQDQIAGDENTMMQQFQARQVAKQRLGELGNLVEEYQTGAAAEFKADAQAYAKAWGIDIPNSATTNAALFQEIQKNAIANIFSNAKDLGGRILVTELAGLAKSNVNAELQPAAAAKIISQQAGLLNYEDAHTSAYFGWKHANPNAYDTSGFEIPWIKSNPVRNFTDAAAKEIAPLGAPLPPHLREASRVMIYRGGDQPSITTCFPGRGSFC